MNKFLLIFFSLFTFLGIEKSKAETFNVINPKSPVVIPLSQKHEFEFGTVPQANSTILLKIKTRMDTSGLGGSMYFLKIRVNGHLLSPRKTRSVSRLINKPLNSPVTPSDTIPWCSDNKWQVLYAPNFTAAYSKKFYVGDPYLYVFDITDLTNPVAENRIEIENCATASFVASVGGKYKKDKKLDMVVGQLEIEHIPELSPTMKVSDAGLPNIINRGEAAAGPAKYDAKLMPGGGLSVKMAGKTYLFSSRFSYPNAGYNYLNPGKPVGGQLGWKSSLKGNRFWGEGKDYKIVREIKLTPHRVEISDKISNLSKDSPLGLAVRNELKLDDMKKVAVRLAGSPDISRDEYFSFGNPSIHVRIPEGGLGMLVEDDVFRNQAKLYVRPSERTGKLITGFHTDMLRLGPGETYTLKWAIYPVAGPDYYDFINLVRKDWGANYTALGPWRWGSHKIKDMSIEEIRKLFKRQGIKFVILTNWVEWVKTPQGNKRIAFGTDVFSDYWEYKRKFYKKMVKKLREAVPDIKIVCYANAMRETSDDTLTKFKDSLQVNEYGAPSLTTWAHLKLTNLTYSMVPTLKNSFGKEMLKITQLYLDELELDGIYWDEFEGILFNKILFSYNNYDGHSCILDPETLTIKREVGIVPLANRPFIDKMVNIVQSQGKILLCNGPTGSRNTLRDKVQRMTEAQHNDYYAYEGHLQTPLGYMSWNRRGWADFLRVLNLGLIPAVCIDTELQHDISEYMFPFTPIEIHAGYMLAKERIIATHSGNYGWIDSRDLVQVRHFNNLGRLTDKEFLTRIANESRVAVKLNEKEAVVLERLPLSIDPQKTQSTDWSVELNKVKYVENEINLSIKALRGGILSVKDGKFPLKNGAVLKVKMGQKELSVKIEDKTVKLPIPVGFNDTVKLTHR